MPDPVVNASPLIVLAKAGLLEFLRLAGETVLVPAPVAAELRAHRNDAGARALSNTPWLKIVVPPATPQWIAAWDLGAGESSVLAWAYANPGTRAILDDLAGRRCAQTASIHIRGTLGLILLAKQRGKIGAARPEVENLRKAGLYLSDTIINRALALVGE